MLGETYRVLPTCAGYVERGIASWYGNKFHGYMTSNFEKYDMYAYTAASKTLPLPCYVRVTNLENGKSAIVRVNDRGPFAPNRIVDLSYVAAVKLGVWPKGTAMVEVRAIDPDHPDSHLPGAIGPIAARNRRARRWSQRRHRKRPNRRYICKSARFPSVERRARGRPGACGATRRCERGGSKVDGKTLRRVRLGPLRDADEADRLAPKLKGLGLGEPRVAVDN